MLYTQTLTSKSLKLLESLMNDPAFDNFRLVGGTSLSLQMGHRISVDLDLFTNDTFDEIQLLEHLRQVYAFELDYIEKEKLKGEIDGVKIDCIAHKYKWLKSVPVIEDSIRMAGLEDIAAMKLNAIVSNGTRVKDFIDIAFLGTKLTLNQMLKAFQDKFNSNAVMVLKAMVYYEDINFKEPVKMMDMPVFDWNIIEEKLNKLLKYPDSVL